MIDAFNKNMPFDQFTLEQLAGDLLPNPSDDQLIASAFRYWQAACSDLWTGDARQR